MKQPKTLTGLVLTASLVARPTYSKPEGARKTKATRGEHLCGLLGSYADEMGDISDNYADQIYTGRRMIPAYVVRYYVHNCSWVSHEKTHLCPRGLYEDIKCYYQSPSITHGNKMILREKLSEILLTIPAIDQEEIMADVNTCHIDADKVYMLLSDLLWYAWRMDPTGYTFLAA